MASSNLKSTVAKLLQSWWPGDDVNADVTKLMDAIAPFVNKSGLTEAERLARNAYQAKLMRDRREAAKVKADQEALAIMEAARAKRRANP